MLVCCWPLATSHPTEYVMCGGSSNPTLPTTIERRHSIVEDEQITEIISEGIYILMRQTPFFFMFV